MVTETDGVQGRPLLGLRPPAELAEDGPRLCAKAVEAAATAQPRPTYPVISSGWDAEDEERSGKSSDLMTALRAGVVLLGVIIALSLLLG